MKLSFFRFASLLLIIIILSSASVFGQENIFNVIEDSPEVCILHPTDVNAQYKYAPDVLRQKRTSQAATSQIEVTYLNNCSGGAWPEDAKTAFEYAADIWEAHLNTPVPIRIEATWAPLDEGILGGTSPTIVETTSSASGDLFPNTLYTIANASAITGTDLVTELDTDFDMTMDINCEFEDWYMGTDANPPAGMYDFVTVFLHEIGHGIGFTGSMIGNATTRIADWGYGQSDFSMVYDKYTLDEEFHQVINTDIYPRRSELLYDALTGQLGGIYFSGHQAEFAFENMRVQLHSPNPFVQGQSYSHLNQQVYGNSPDALMRPFLDAEFAVHSPGPIFCGLLNDFNWPLGQACLDLLPDEGFLNRPFLVFPANGSFESTLDPTMMWQAVAGAAEYRIQVATDFNFEDVIIDQVVTGTSYDIQQNLEYSTLYFWRVQAMSAGGNSKFSSKYRFTTTNSPPDAIALTQPDDNAENMRPGFSFVWQASSRADEYQIQVADNPDFSSPEIDATVSVPRYLNTSVLDFSTMYYWRVRGLNSAGPGDWSEVRSFSTIIEKPDPVTLISPSENENQVSVSATLNWSKSSRASEYNIQVSQNESFSSDAVIQLTSSEPMVTLSNPLEFATIYYWRVKATNIGGESDWSEANQFTTVVRETAIMPNYPNPFNATTTIRFQLSENSDVTLDIFDSVGRRVSVLVDEERAAGVYFEQLQAASLASGTYFIRIIAGDFMEVQKMAIIK